MRVRHGSTRSAHHLHRSHRANRESGVALIIALICLLVVSCLAAAMIVSTQSEIWTTYNYRLVTQARYAAEAGSQLTVDYLQNNWHAPASPLFTDTANFDRTSFPVKYIGTLVSGCSTKPYTCTVVMNAGAFGIASGTYAFDTTDETNFKNVFYPSSAPATLSLPSSAPAGTTPTYAVAAQLLEVDPDPNNAGGWITSWKVFSQGTVGKARVQLVEVVNKVATSGNTPPPVLFPNGVVALGTSCGAIKMSGGSVLKSYDSTLSGKSHTLFSGASDCGGASDPTKKHCANVASGGTVELSGSTSVDGVVTSTLTGTVSNNTCPSVAAVGWSGGPAIPGGAVAINKVASLPTPPAVNIPAVPANTAACVDPDRNNPLLPSWAKGTLDRCNGGSNVGTVTLTNGQSFDTNQMTLTPNPSGNYGNVTFAASTVVTLSQSGTYNFNSLHASAGSSIVIPTGVSVTINIIGATPTFNGTTNALMFDGNGNMVTADSAGNVLIQYNGTLPIVYSGSGALVGVINAPNSNFNYSGAGITYGAVISQTTTFSGSGVVEYDVDLGNHGLKGAPPSGGTTPMHIDQFSWSVY